MVNDAVWTRKSKDNELGSSMKNVSGSDASVLRRSTRGQNKSSPVGVRKSQRLEKQTAPATPVTPPSAKKAWNSSPLRRSVRENKSNSVSIKEMVEKGSPSSEGSKQQNKGARTLDSSKGKGTKQNKTLKEIAQEVKEKGKQNDSSEVSSKRKMRLDARRYREMFRSLKKSKVSGSESDKKSKLENSDDSGDSSPEKVDEEEQEQSDGEDLKGDLAKDIDGDAGDSNSRDIEDRGLLVSRDHNVCSPSSPRNEAAQNSEKTEEVSGSVMEKLSNQEIPSASNTLSDNDNGSGCSQKGTFGASADGREGTGKCPMDVASSVSSSCKMSIFAEECAKCLKRQRLDNDSPEHELCCCLSNNVNDMDDFEDRGQCGIIITAEFAEELSRDVKQSGSLLDDQRNTCATCKLAGKLLHCIGKECGRCYHPPCSLNPEENIYLSNWFCSDCTVKRLVLGVHSVSEGIESILDVRNVDMSDTEGRLKQKQCLVKYKGLAHIHNRWVPEIQLVHEAPELCAKPGKQKEDTHWNPDLAVPHRLLRRRSVIVYDKPIDQEVGLESKSQYEWLVKWCGLDYDQATWESEDSSFLKKPEAQRLIGDYETRHNTARKTSLSESIEVQGKKKDPQVKLGKVMVGGADSYYLSSVKKLREYHHKGHNAVLLDEKDRIVKVIHLVSSLVTHVCRPFLIISPYASLPSWEAEFVHLATSVNVVVYGGNSDARHIIRTLEFYEEGGQVMLQVLLSSAEAIAEDVEELKGIKWEAVIIDDCQQSSILTHSGSIMNLATGWRLLLMNAQLKDNMTDYLNMLSLLEPGGSINQNPVQLANTNEDINVLKDRLSSFIICASFLEYWVPVEISNFQLELYCYSILLKSDALLKFLKSDPVGSLREILISLRKCCDHPYIVDWKYQALLNKDLSAEAGTEVDIRASGKLHFLDKLLPELKNQELKVLILFQSTSGSGRDTTAFVLEDLLRLRFGTDSYEYVASGLVPSKKQAACNQFNTIRERTFFLLETRACSQIIKLSSVDAVILFDSDWNPHVDLRALQKITLDSKLEQIKVFRLYCPCTVEEKVLILAKNDMILDSTLQNITPSTSHMLLMWGSSNLFSRLDEFHRDKILDYKEIIVFGSSFLTDVSKEIVSLFQNRKNVYSSKYISVARQNGGCYLKCIPLIGEQKIQQEGVPPHVFWTKLLEGKQPQWKYFSGSFQTPQRIRKRHNYSEDFLSEVQIDEAAKRHKKMAGFKIDSSSQHVELRREKPNSGNKEHQESIANKDPSYLKNFGTTLSVMPNGETHSVAEFGDIKHLHNEQRSLFEFLKPTLSDLCEALLLEDDEKRLVEQFLEHLIKNYRVTREPQTTLQAFLLSLCWTATEELKNKIDHEQSFTIARERVGFKCTECEAEGLYLKLKPKMEMFLYRRINYSDLKDFVESSLDLQKNLAVELEKSSLVAKGYEKYVKKVEKECEKQMENLKKKQNEEVEKFEKSWEELKMKLERWCKVESSTIRYTYANTSIGIDKLRALDNDYAKKREDLEKQISNFRKELEARQKIERDDEQKKIAGYIKRVKSLEHHKLLEESHAKNGVSFQVAEPLGLGKESNGIMGVNENLPRQQSSKRENKVSVPAENLENTGEQRVSCEDDESLTAKENVSASKGPIGLGNELNGTVDFNGYIPKQKNSEKEANVSELAENLENTDEQRVSYESDDYLTAFENVTPSEGPVALDREFNRTLSINGDVPKQQNFQRVLAENLEDTDKQRVSCENNDSLTSIENSLASKGPNTSTCPPEQPYAPSRQNEKDTNHIDDGVVDRSTVVGSNEVNGASTMGRLLSPVGSLTEHPTADTSQALRDESHNGVEAQVGYSTETHNTMPSGERSSSNRSNHVPSGLLRNEGTSSSTEASFNEWVTHYNDQTGVASNSRLGVQPIDTSIFGTVTPRHQDRNSGLGEAVSQSFSQLPVHLVPANQVQMSMSTISRVPTSHHFDPLQNELDRICKEIRNVMINHEQTKLQLKSECDKEIEELVAQIRRKYDKKIDEAEASFSTKRNELEMCQNKVIMHKMLAEAFRSKCTDYKAAARMQQPGNPSSSVEIASQLHPTRPFSPAGPFSATSPATGPHSAAPPLRGIRPSMTLSSQATISHVIPIALTGVAGQQQQVRRESRAPAPRIQLFRPASPVISSSSMPSGGVLVAQPPNNPTSTSAPQLPPQLPPPPPPTQQLNPRGQSQQGESTGRGAPLSLSLSATQLLMDITRQHNANVNQHSSNAPPLPDSVRNSESWDISRFEEATNLQPSRSNLLAGDDVVCLSDDD